MFKSSWMLAQIFREHLRYWVFTDNMGKSPIISSLYLISEAFIMSHIIDEMARSTTLQNVIGF